jgi:hypothetical protein
MQGHNTNIDLKGPSQNKTNLVPQFMITPSLSIFNIHPSQVASLTMQRWHILFYFSSAFALCIKHFAFYSGFYLAQEFRLQLYWRGVHSRLHIYTLVMWLVISYTLVMWNASGIFCLPWRTYSGTRNLGFTSHSKDIFCPDCGGSITSW